MIDYDDLINDPDPIIQKMVKGEFSRTDRKQVYDNATKRLKKNIDVERAKRIIYAYKSIEVPPLQQEYVFMGFCPGATLENRQDELWYADGICEFDWVSDPVQMKRFYDIQVGDIIVTKKREKFGETMMLSGHGKVRLLEESRRTGKRYLRVDWIVPDKFLIVPLIGCHSTVNTRSLKMVEEMMPEEFWEWLGEGRRVD
ncbi:hypothetical protein [Pseudidiomarina taiwanensis]|uniref:Uncharacterized protein n=1 Tax=Pseudidiomarina taiwanensis TaxID=337250 RepID=A0A432ZEQ2_9GAMM|nr:hypothetical protein [Pseudidiomarina taiwanensis]RUO76447.1 hypothetical protein CWI83_08790 [Pseudidiomarina taiwanensis]